MIVAIRMKLLILISFLPFVGSAAFAQDFVDNMFEIATKPPSQWGVDSSKNYKWVSEEIGIAFHVAGPDKGEFLKYLHPEFQEDAEFLSAKSGKTLDIKLWDGMSKDSSIYVYAGNQRDLIAYSPELDQIFGLGFTEQIKKLIEEGEPICFSSVSLGGESEITRAVIIVDRSDYPNFCLRRQLISAFGLFGELPTGTDSILGKGQNRQFFSELDSALLKILYLR